MQASIHVQEKTTVNWQDVVLSNEADGISDEPESKGRRLNAKTANPPGYAPADSSVPNVPTSDPSGTVEAAQASSRDDVKQVLMDALHQAPRVGRLVIQDGNLFDRLQAMFPEYRIRVVELCKGADRFRKPPIKLAPREAPWRMTMCLHRHHLEPCENHGWINWETLSTRKICSSSPPSRIMISIFAQPHETDEPKHAPAQRHDTETRCQTPTSTTTAES